jgi:hypothetical protein
MSEETQTLLSRDDLLAESPRRFKTVGPLPARGGYVRLRSLTEQEGSAFDTAKFNKGEYVSARLLDMNCRYLSLCIVDQAGNRLLGPSDVPKMLTAWDRADIEYLYGEARAHVTAKQVPIEETEKNSEGTPAAG